MNLDERRSQLMAQGLARGDVASDPVEQFDRWYREAHEAGLYQPHAMVVATADLDGHPSARFVLLRGHDGKGFRFFTDTESAKGADLAANDSVALLFPWQELARQVRVEGRAERVSDREADEYWATRPEGSRTAARASHQSAPVADRAALDAAFDAVEREFPAGAPRPERWGGYRVAPRRVEFWQGRENRFHDRVVYDRRDGRWEITRLQP